MILQRKERQSNLLSKYLQFGPVTGRTSDGRPVREAKCTLCHQIFSNDRSGYKHLKNIHNIANIVNNKGVRKLDEFFDINTNNAESFDNSVSQKEAEITVVLPTNTITQSQIRLILAICNLGIPLQTIGRREWMEFLAEVGAQVIVKPKKLRSLIMIYKTEIKSRIRREIKGKNITLITDGGTICDKTYYVCILFCDKRLYFGGLAHVERSDHESIAKGLYQVLSYYLKKDSSLIGIVSDNASNILLATTDKNQPGPKINLQNQVISVQKLFNMKTLHISCGIHTANLILKDMMIDPNFASFKNGLVKLFKFLREKDIRLLAREKGIHFKIPLIQEIKWLCYLQAINFINTFRNQINEILMEKYNSNDNRIDID